MRKIKLTIAYCGTNYRGFQTQPGGNTIQDVLEAFLSQVCGEPVTVAASGRTDAGVHAWGQVVSFATNGIIPCHGLLRAGKSLLPKDVAILQAEEMPWNFHARFCAKWKEYLYRIYLTEQPNPLLWDRAWLFPYSLDVALMQEAAVCLLGTHDYSAFCSAGGDSEDHVRSMYGVKIWQENQNVFVRIAGNGFLYHMVRNLVWSLVQVGMHKRSVKEFGQELLSCRRNYPCAPAPAGGLSLLQVGYEDYVPQEQVP